MNFCKSISNKKSSSVFFFKKMIIHNNCQHLKNENNNCCFLFIRPSKEWNGPVRPSVRPSVRLSVRLSVRPSTIACVHDILKTAGRIDSYFDMTLIPLTPRTLLIWDIL